MYKQARCKGDVNTITSPYQLKKNGKGLRKSVESKHIDVVHVEKRVYSRLLSG